MSRDLWLKDWEKINEIILKMNSESDVLKSLNTFLVDVEKLVPYEKACIYFYDLSGSNIVKEYMGQGFSKKERSAKGTVKYLICPIVGALLCLYLLVHLDKFAIILGCAWTVAGIIYLLVLTKGFKNEPPELGIDG